MRTETKVRRKYWCTKDMYIHRVHLAVFPLLYGERGGPPGYFTKPPC